MFYLRRKYTTAAARRLAKSTENRSEGVSKYKFLEQTQRCIRIVKMQGAEVEGKGSVLQYMTEPEVDSNAADWLF